MIKRALIVGQIFIYILAIIVFSLIMLFGFNAIRNILQTGEKAQFVDFKTTLENEIRTITSQYGDVMVFDDRNQLRVPGNYKELCFIDIDSNPASSAICASQDEEKRLICDSWTTSYQNRQILKGPFENVFLVPSAPSKIFIQEKIKIDANADGNPDATGELCIKTVAGRVNLRLEGRGTYVLISEK